MIWRPSNVFYLLFKRILSAFAAHAVFVLALAAFGAADGLLLLNPAQLVLGNEPALSPHTA